MNSVLTLILAVVAACGASVATGLLTRPKTKAEAGQAIALGEVAVSGDAREWARDAMARAQRAEAKVDDVTRRCDETERKLEIAIGYIRDQGKALIEAGGHPPPVPPELIPPLAPTPPH